MSLTEIEQAVKGLNREELAKLAAYIAKQDKLSWDEQLEEDFSPGGKHASALEKIDAEIDAGTSGRRPIGRLHALDETLKASVGILLGLLVTALVFN